MKKTNSSANNELKQQLELITSHWLIISLSLVIAVSLAYSYLRYETYQYNASATIKIQDDTQSQKLPSLEDITGKGLFANGSNKILDEIEVIQSRTLIENVVKDLNLNIKYYTQGQIKELEIYNNPPLKLNFFAHDSIIHNVDTTLFIKIISPSKYLMFKDDGKSLIDRDESHGDPYNFGDKIKTGFGDVIIVPNIGKYAPIIGSNLRVSIVPVRKVVDDYQKRIAVSTETGSSVVKLELKDNIPERAIDILNNLINEYNNDVIADKESVIEITSDFINNRLQVVSKELNEVDFTAEQLQKKNKLTALGSQANLYLESERITEDRINSTTNTIQLIDYLKEEIKEKHKSSDLLPANIIEDPAILQVTRTHNELVAQRESILKNSSEINPTVINLDNQINALKDNLENTLESLKKTNELTLNSLSREGARIRGQLYSAPTRERQFRDIERQQGIKESLFLYLLQQREESAISLGMFSPKAKIIDHGYSSFLPVSPNKMLTYLGAILFGLAVPIGSIYLLNILDNKIHNKEDLIKILDIPYIGDIPKTSKKNKIVKQIDYSPKAEAFRILRSNIDFMLSGNSGNSKKLFITSTTAQEGKSHTSTNLAMSISYSEKSVLLIEADVRIPKIMAYLNKSEKIEKGLSDFIIDKSIKPQDIVVHNKENPFIDIIPSGTLPPNPSELLMSDRVGELFEYFDKIYDYIIVDTSAVGLVSDTLLISKYADMFIYVVSANNIDKRQLVHVARPLYEKKRLPNMTLLLNGVKTGSEGYGYGYGNNPQKQKKGLFRK
ncbi:polysaccharide biosynthesis tyrosine autokinase [Gelidibacter japonicus]|uniref:GumC family protein n=1 Tax=Gelidibacter japonicus TaxID=1962232 RepID=UPI00201FBBBE|nr:polysaccharide biosynthesis tyrosine autokinase [Gelidibacter japonicus]MCL8005988.1 polysaccharide biosynthesis tyrosine autokinase [Gelidibacter japonicus]